MRRLLLTAALCAAASAALAQQSQVLVPTVPALNPSNNLSDVGSAAAGRANLGMPAVANPLEYMPGTACTGGTDVSTGVAAAITAGFTHIRIPANCTYYPPSDMVPAGIEIVGDDWNTSIVSVANRATTTLRVGGKVTLRNVGIISNFCDVSADPVSTQKICPVGAAYNTSTSTIPITNWVNQPILLNAGTTTSPDGVAVVDAPLLAVQQAGTSDGIYVSTSAAQTAHGSGVGIRIVTAGTGDSGVLVLNGGLGSLVHPDHRHQGIFIKENSDNSNNSKSLYIDRTPVVVGQDVAPSIWIDDSGSASTSLTSPDIQINVAKQSGGPLVNIFHSGLAFPGNVFQANMGNGGGAFTGNFLQFLSAGSSVAKIDANGNATLAGLTVTGSSTMQGGMTVSGGDLVVSGGNSLQVAGAGGATIGGTLGVTGGTSVSTLAASGFASLQSNGWLGAASANYISWQGAASSGSPAFSAIGSDTDIAFRFLGKGAKGALTGVFTSSGDPTTTNIPTGTCADWNNTTAVTYKHWCNFGGSLKFVTMN